MSKNNSILSSRQLKKSFHDGRHTVSVLTGIDFDLEAGDRVAIVGPSGSGKSTLLHLWGGIDKPTSGHVYINQTDWQTVSERKRCRIRNSQLGFIYQFHHLLPEFTALENVCFPLWLANQSIVQAKKKAEAMLDTVGLAERLHHKPAQLSGGERQRVAIARALIHEPACVLADEPTGNLDQASAMNVFDLMLHLNTKHRTALVLVTHDLNLAGKMSRVFNMKMGQLDPCLPWNHST